MLCAFKRTNNQRIELMLLNLLKISLLAGLLPSLLLAQEQGKIPFVVETQRSETAASVFIDFAHKHYGTHFEEKMKLKGDSPLWSARITINTKQWTPEEARAFLQSMVEKIGVQETLKQLKRPSYLKTIKYRVFQKTVQTLYAWAGKEAAANKLMKSLSGTDKNINENVALSLIDFFRTTKTPPEDILENLEKDLRHYQVKEGNKLVSLFQNIFDKRGRLEGLDPKATMSHLWERFFSLDMQYQAEFVSRLEDHLDFMDDYLQSWEIVKDMMLKNTADFASIKLRPFKRVIRFFRGRPIEEDKIKELISKNIKGIAIARSRRLRNNARHLEEMFFDGGGVKALTSVREAVNQMMFKNLTDFYSMDFKELDEVRLFMRNRDIPEERINQTFRKNIDGIESARKERLKPITRHMEIFFKSVGIENPKSATNEMMLGNLGSYSRINLRELDQITVFLRKRGIPGKRIAEAFIKSSEGTALARKKRLEFVSTYMQALFGGGGDAKEVTDEMMLQNLSRFTNLDTSELDELQDFLKKRNVPKEKIQPAFRKNIEGLSKIKTRNFKRGIEHLDALFLDEKNAAEIVNQIALKDLISISRIVPREMDITLNYLRNRSFSETLLQELVKGDIKGIADFRLKKLNPMIQHMDNFFGAAVVDQMMLNNFDVFISIKIEPFDALVAALRERNIPDDKITKTLAGNVLATASAKVESLKLKANQMQAFFENLGLSAEEAKITVDEMIIKNLHGFCFADMAKLKNLAVTLKKRSMADDKIIKILTKGALSVTSTKGKRLEPVARHMQAFFEEFTGKEEAGKIVDEMVFQNLTDFSSIDTEEFDKLVGVLKKRGVRSARLGDWVRKNIKNLALLSHEKLEEASERMDVFFERLINQAMLESTVAFSEVTNEKLIARSADCKTLVAKILSD